MNLSLQSEFVSIYNFKCLQEYAEKYAVDQDAFFKDYAEAHASLSTLRAKFDPPQVCLQSFASILLFELYIPTHSDLK